VVVARRTSAIAQSGTVSVGVSSGCDKRRASRCLHLHFQSTTSDIISVSATKAGGGFNAGDLVSTQMVLKGFSVAVKSTVR